MAYIYKNGKIYAGGGGGDGIFNDMDAQELEVFLSGIEAEGPNLADYVIEQGENNYWTYRKWNSGVAECWGKRSSSSVNITSANGYLYDAVLGTESFPSGLFTSAPTVLAITHNPSGGRFLSLMVATVTASGVTFKVISSISGAIAFDFDIHAIGKWK